MMHEFTPHELQTLITESQKMANYDAFIKKGDVDELKRDVMWFFKSVLLKEALTHKEIKDNFTSAINGPSEVLPDGNDFQDYIQGAKCVLGDDFWSTILDGEYVILRSSILDIALIFEPKMGNSKRQIDETALRSMVKDEFIDSEAKDAVIDVLQNTELGSDLSISTAEKELNKRLGSRWTVFVTFEKAVPLYTFSKSGEFIHFSDGTVTILVAYHPAPLAECFEHLTIDDITKVETHGDVAKRHIDKAFRENLVEKLKGISSTDQAVKHVKDILSDCPHHLIIFAKAVSEPSSQNYAILTIKYYTLLIVF